MISIDLNCDLGESYGDKIVGNDGAVFPYISSCNIACGAHGGDNKTIEETIKLAIEHQVQIGAHPSYPDLAGFGRRDMKLTASELNTSITGQLEKVDSMCRAYNTQIHHVKAHGALYNRINKQEKEAKVFLETVRKLNSSWAIMGLPNSPLQQLTEAKGMRYIREGFIDRLYQEDGQLTPRKVNGAVFESADDMLAQFKSLVMESKVKTATGNYRHIEIDSVCIHGDNPSILVFLKALQKEIASENIQIKRSLA